MEIKLTPAGNLRLIQGEEELTPQWISFRDAFESNWREGLFRLSASKMVVDSLLTLRFWQDFSGRYLTALCHIPEGAVEFQVPSLEPGVLATLTLTAPPMQGGEYLSVQVLADVWNALDQWCHQAVKKTDNLSTFLQTNAPLWNQVGRVCFHLAENKNNDKSPFAFMASYASGFGTSGKLKYLPLHRALEQYSGVKNRDAMIKLLTPVHRAAEKCRWVHELVESSNIYRPMAWSSDQAYTFLKTCPLVESCGVAVRLPNWWAKRLKPKVNVVIGDRKSSRFGARTLLDFSMSVALGAETLTPEEIEALLNSDDGLVMIRGQWVELDREKLKEAIAHWENVRRMTAGGELSFFQGMRLLAGSSMELDQTLDLESSAEWSVVIPGAALSDILAKLRNPSIVDQIGVRNGFKAILRPYQKDGLSWLLLLKELNLGACLADDMGLGKTIQVLAMLTVLQQDREGKQPSLLVIPASLVGNWLNEAARFAPTLKVKCLHPSEIRRQQLDEIALQPDKHLADVDLAITTYSMLSRQKWLAAFRWRTVILDEAQAIRNAGTQQSRAARRLQAEGRVALTGTPIENRLSDLWSIFNFLNPGLLGSATEFKSFVQVLQERDKNQFAPLRRLIEPYILRRMKTDRRIISDLPDKTEMKCFCSLTKQQAALYEQTVRNMEKAMKELTGIERRGVILQTLMRLKQICNHPSQLVGDCDYQVAQSGKFQRIVELCGELSERQEKVLIFTQFKEIIDPLAANLAVVFGQPGLILHGGTNVARRKEIVKLFQDEAGPPFFILSLKAGGTGLNLTAASHVIHFDRWWNPAVENQATDRAFRIGQKKNVVVHKFVTRGTVEEHIDHLIEDKKGLAAEILSGSGELKLTEMSDDQILKLIQLDIKKAMI